MKLWEWLDGKKTAIGAGAGAAATLLQGIGDIWRLDEPWYNNVIKTLVYVSGVFGGPGVVHKWMKSRNAG